MDPKNNTTGDGQPAIVADLTPALPVDVKDTPSAPKVDSLTLEEINVLTNKNFPDKETALKAIKDNFSFVGKKKEDVATDLVNKGEYISKKELDTEFLYRENKLASDNRTIIDSFAKANNLTAREALERPEIKSILDKVKNYDASQSIKSVIETNPKLGQLKDSSTEVKNLVLGGNKEEAGLKAAKTLIETLGI